MRSQQRLLLATSSLLAFALVGGEAKAAPPARSSSQFTLRRDEAGASEATAARQRARAGDCASALPAFDAAIRTSVDPTLHRDRGLCHERLDHPFPAIEDYRAYVVARPDAPDADEIRERLTRLEESVGTVGRADDEPASGSASAKDEGGAFDMSASMSMGSGGASAQASGKSRVLGPREGERERGYDYYLRQEELADMAAGSSLRRGTGWIVGAYLNIPRYFARLSDGSGSTADLNFGAGLGLRYAFAEHWSFISELGYAGVIDRGESMGGVMLLAGAEYRAPLDRFATNQLYLGVGLGYERFSTSGSDFALNYILGRGRFGYRHVIGPSVAFEIGLDGGPGVAVASGGGGSDSVGVAVIGGALGFVVGF